jgi:endonuclease/exonuclease/phosphatase family metal-dependent hydrolase
VWAFDGGDPPEAKPNSGTADAAVSHYTSFLQAMPGVVAGDFNAGVRWDGQSGCASFADLDGRLRALGMTSAYHAKLGHALGQEPDPTHFWQWNERQPFHIDYVYVPSAWLPCVRSVTVGTAARWLEPKLSDHAPVVVDCDLPPQAVLRSLAGLPADALPLTART